MSRFKDEGSFTHLIFFFPRNYLERPRGDVAVFAWPQLFNKLRVGFGNLPLHAQWIVLIQLICVLVFEEVLRQRRGIA